MELPPTKPDPKQVIFRIVLCGHWGLTCLIHRGCSEAKLSAIEARLSHSDQEIELMGEGMNHLTKKHNNVRRELKNCLIYLSD